MPPRIFCHDPHRPQWRIAVVTIATGEKYITKLLPGFLASVRKFFFPKDSVDIFVFTDAGYTVARNIVQMNAPPQPDWGQASMARWKFLLGLNTTLAVYDWVVFLDVDYEIVWHICDEYLSPLFGVLQPQWWPLDNKLPFETRPASAAYVPSEMRRVYFFGSQFGGRPAEIQKLAAYCQRLKERDDVAGIVPANVDESQLNHYFNVVRWPTKIHDKRHCVPEPFEQFRELTDYAQPIIVHRDKARF